MFQRCRERERTRRPAVPLVPVRTARNRGRVASAHLLGLMFPRVPGRERTRRPGAVVPIRTGTIEAALLRLTCWG